MRVSDVGDRQRRIVGDEQAVARLVGRIEVHDHHQVGRALGHRHADIAHVDGQPRLRDRDAVLHLHLGDVEIGAEIEGHRDREASVRRRVRRHVDHVLDAVDLLLDRRHHGRGDDVGAGAGILPGHVDDRRRDLRILRDRQARERHAADDHEHDRDDGGEDRTIDEKMRNAHRPAGPSVGLGARRARRRGRLLAPRASPFAPGAPASGR